MSTGKQGLKWQFKFHNLKEKQNVNGLNAPIKTQTADWIKEKKKSL